MTAFQGSRRLVRLAAAAVLSAVAFTGAGMAPATAAPTPEAATGEATKAYQEPMVSAPSKVNAVRNKNGTVTMSWQPPTKIVSSKVLRYMVVVHPFTNMEKRYTVSASTRKLTVKDPAPGGQLSIGVRVEAQALNKQSYPWNFHPIYFTDGKATYTPVTGQWSKFGGNIQLASAPKATVVNARSVTISWPKPKLPNGTVTSIKLQAVNRISMLIDTPKLSTTATSATVTGLEPNSDYYMTLTIDAISADGKTKDSITRRIQVKTSKGPALSPVVKVGIPPKITATLVNGKVSVTWAKPTVTGTITEYTLYVGMERYSLNPTTFSKTVPAPTLGKFEVAVNASAVSADGRNFLTGESARKLLAHK
jgi:hypothetical protein